MWAGGEDLGCFISLLVRFAAGVVRPVAFRDRDVDRFIEVKIVGIFICVAVKDHWFELAQVVVQCFCIRLALSGLL